MLRTYEVHAQACLVLGFLLNGRLVVHSRVNERETSLGLINLLDFLWLHDEALVELCFAGKHF